MTWIWTTWIFTWFTGQWDLRWFFLFLFVIIFLSLFSQSIQCLWCKIRSHCKPLHKCLFIIAFQSGSEQFPLDSEGLTIGDDSNFLDTWEVWGYVFALACLIAVLILSFLLLLPYSTHFLSFLFLYFLFLTLSTYHFHSFFPVLFIFIPNIFPFSSHFSFAYHFVSFPSHFLPCQFTLAFPHYLFLFSFSHSLSVSFFFPVISISSFPFVPVSFLFPSLFNLSFPFSLSI